MGANAPTTSGQQDCVAPAPQPVAISPCRGECPDLAPTARHPESAVLDAIATQIVVIDPAGRIVQSNSAWREACAAGRSAGVGGLGPCENYLDCCRLLVKGGDDSAAEILEVISAVLRGDCPQATVEFQLSDPQREERWISLKVAPLPERAGAVLFHEDLTLQHGLERELIEISERQKRRIGQDLHDGVCPHFSGVAMLIKTLANRLATTQPTEGRELAELVDLVQDGIDQVRAIARGLHPVELDLGGLERGLRELAQTCSRRVPTTLWCDETLPELDGEVATNLYRIAQEAVNNAIRHSGATSISIVLGQTATHVMLEVTDNGRGFTVTKPRSAGMGLSIMRYRASAIHARLDMGNAPGGGVRIRCRVPLSSSRV